MKIRGPFLLALASLSKTPSRANAAFVQRGTKFRNHKLTWVAKDLDDDLAVQVDRDSF
jgi:hypothetical protein